jgi:hypothetical protein
MERVAGIHAVHRRAGMLIAEEARLHTVQVRQVGGARYSDIV